MDLKTVQRKTGVENCNTYLSLELCTETISSSRPTDSSEIFWSRDEIDSVIRLAKYMSSMDS